MVIIYLLTWDLMGSVLKIVLHLSLLIHLLYV